MSEYVSRRSFIKRTGAGLAAASMSSLAVACSTQKASFPRRALGKTGLEISMLTFGGGSQFLKNKDGEWEPMLERAIQLGINTFDTASNYKWSASMSSEERFGKILPAYRDKIHIITKFESRNPDEAMKEIEKSLTDLRTDYVDCLLLHSVEKSEDLDVFARDVYPMLQRLKEQGVAKNIGFSSMNSAEKSRDIIQSFDIDVCLLAMNPTKYGAFAEIALPAAREKNVGVIAMKLMRDIVGDIASPEELIHYALNKDGVASACIGHFGMDKMIQNAEIVAAMGNGAKASNVDEEELERRLAHLAGPHALCWARHDYFDGKMC